MRRAGVVILVLAMLLLVLWQTGAINYILSRTLFRPDYIGEDNGEEDPPPVSIGFSVDDLEYDIEVLAEDLSIPWDMAILPDGRMMITERPGRVLLLPERKTVLDLDVLHVGEGGLLGIALDPNFEMNRYVLLYYTYRSGATISNRVVRYEFTSAEILENERVLVDALPGATIHNGGRIRFGPDGMLYVCSGDASDSDRAQDVDDLAGKILRYRADGSIPDDNPNPESPVYSFGHRNPQGLAWNPENNQLYASEHGPRMQDEINRILAGANYGWPEVTCSQGHDNFEAPVTCYADFTLAPSGMDFLSMEGMAEISLFVGGLRGNMVRRLDFNGEGDLLAETSMFTEWGRIRNVTVHEGELYILTNNRDGRGVPQSRDDKLIRIVPVRPPAEQP